MISVSTDFKRSVFNENNNFLIRLEITLQDDTRLTVENDNIMSNGLLIDDAVSEDEDFTALGSTIINACDVILYNNNNVYSDYEFKYAKVTVYIGLNVGGTLEEFKRGVFTVDDAVYGDATISLSLLDNMAQFDRPYSESSLVYPATLLDIVRDACSVCDVPFATNSLRFPHYTFNVATKPSEESTTFREVIGWAATIAGCYARCNTEGELEFKWFDVNALDTAHNDAYDGGTFNPWSEGDIVDGGTFNPWSAGNTVDGGTFQVSNNVHYISSLRSQSLGVDDVVITGVRITVEIDDPESDEDIIQATSGTDDYLIEIEGNQFITVTNMATVLNWLATQLIGLRFRKCNIQTLGNPIIEAGDVALIWDSKGVEHPILVTRVSFSPTALQEIVCGAAQVTRNSAVRFSEQTKSYVAMRKQLRQQRNTYDAAIEDLNDKIANASGLHKTEVTQPGGATVTYYHNKPELSDSDIQIVISDVGITVTSNGTDEHPTWYGLEVNGTLIASIMNTIGINFDWGVGGELIIKSGNTETFYANAETGVVRIRANSFSLSNGDTIDSIAQGKANTALQDAKTYTDTVIDNYSTEVDAIIANLQDQIDGQIESWYYDYEPTLNNIPASNWTTESDKKAHEGDVFYWDSMGYAYRFMNDNGTWKWKLIEDSQVTQAIQLARNAQDTADNKRRVFVATPTPPYDIGDLWVQGSSGDIMRCATARATGSYTASDWVKASKYTDDTAVTTLNNSLTQQEVFNRLTNNGTAQGIFLTEDGKLYINGTYIQTGIISDATGSSYWNLEDGIFNLVGEFTLLKSYFLAKMSYSQIDTYDVDSNDVVKRISGTNRLGYTMQFRESDTPYTQMAFQPTKNSMLVGYTYNSDVAPSTVFFRESIFTKYTSTASGTNEYGFERYVSSLYSIGLVNFTTKERQFTMTAAQNHVYGIFGKQRNVSSASVAFDLGTSQLTIKCAGTSLSGSSSSTYLSWKSKNLAYVSSSSKRYKKEIEELKDENLNPHKLYDLQPKQFKYNKDAPLQYPDMEDKLIPGFIAEEVAEIYPAAVIYDDDKRIESWDERRIIPGMLSLIQEQKQKIDELEERIARLEKLLLKEE